MDNPARLGKRQIVFEERTICASFEISRVCDDPTSQMVEIALGCFPP